jgi:hypothetical protein
MARTSSRSYIREGHVHLEVRGDRWSHFHWGGVQVLGLGLRRLTLVPRARFHSLLGGVTRYDSERVKT